MEPVNTSSLDINPPLENMFEKVRNARRSKPKEQEQEIAETEFKHGWQAGISRHSILIGGLATILVLLLNSGALDPLSFIKEAALK